MLRQALTASLLAVMLGLFCRTFVVQPMQIRTGSMKDTLLPGDHVLFSRLIYTTGGALSPLLPSRAPRRGDVVLLLGPDRRPYVKRCVALPGDRLSIRRGRVVLDGIEQSEAWARIRVGDLDAGEVRLGEGQFFVLGDHRAESRDSRHWGPVDRAQLMGRASFIYWSTVPLASPPAESSQGWDRITAVWLNRLSSTRWDRWWQPVH